MKLKIDWTKKVQIIIIAIGFLSACQPSSPIVNNPDTAETEIVIAEKVADVNNMPISQPLYDVVVVGDTTRPEMPQPDVIFQTGTEWRSLLGCPDLAGEIWLMKPPYQHAEQLLADSETAYLQPQWSPDGQWIVYWQSEMSDIPPEETGEFSWQFREDSIWVMRPDGQERKQLTDIFLRSTATGFYGNCGLTGGILHLVGWSQDSQWVAFLADPDKYLYIKPQLYLVNIYSGESHFLPGIWHASWIPDSNVLISASKKTIEIVNVENDVSITSIPVPQAVQAEYVVFDAYLVANTKSLFAISRPRINNYNTPRSLWLVDVVSNEWLLQSSVELGTNVSGLYFTDEFILLCNNRSGPRADLVEMRVLPSWESSHEVESHCDSLRYLFDDEGNGWLGNFVSSTQKSVQVTDLQTFTTETLIDWANTNIPNQRYVANFDWFLP